MDLITQSTDLTDVTSPANGTCKVPLLPGMQYNSKEESHSISHGIDGTRGYHNKCVTQMRKDRNRI